MGDRAAKDALFDGFAEVAKALGNGRRAEIVDVLAQGERPRRRDRRRDRPERGQHVPPPPRHGRAPGCSPPAATAPASTTASPANGSASCGRRCATSPPSTSPASTLSPRAYLGDRDGVELIDRDELARRLERRRRRRARRPPGRRVHGRTHRRRPCRCRSTELRRQLRSLPNDGDVVAYCRGPYCVYADDAVRLLSRRGLRARRLEDGFPEWKRAGLPVADVGARRERGHSDACGTGLSCSTPEAAGPQWPSTTT